MPLTAVFPSCASALPGAQRREPFLTTKVSAPDPLSVSPFRAVAPAFPVSAEPAGFFPTVTCGTSPRHFRETEKGPESAPAEKSNPLPYSAATFAVAPNRSRIAAAQSRPSLIAQTTREAPRTMSPTA